MCSNTDTEQSEISEDYQESTEHVEADEVDNGEAAATGSLLSGVVVWLWITQLPWQTGQHDLLPGLTCGTPNIEQETTLTQGQNEGFFHMYLYMYDELEWLVTNYLSYTKTPEEH